MLTQIPNSLSFNDLQLEYVAKDELRFNVDVLRQYMEHNDMPPEQFENFPAFPAVGPIILAWYLQHRMNGGEPNASIDYMFALVDAKPAQKTKLH